MPARDLSMSNIIGPADPQRLMWEMSLGEFLDTAVHRNADQVFVEIGGEAVTYAQFQQNVRRTGAMLKDLGVGYGDRVCLFLPNCLEFLSCWFGLSYLGAIGVPINTAYKRDETAYILNNSGAVALVAHATLSSTAAQAAVLAESVRSKLIVAGDSSPGWRSFSEATSAATPMTSPVVVAPHATSMLGYTSGTTGNPKGVKVSHLMYVAVGQGFAYWTQATSEDRFFTCLPYFHANVQFYSTMGAMACGATLVVEERFSASEFWAQVRTAKATIVNFIGMMMPVLTKQEARLNDRKNGVRLFYGSPAFSPDFLQAFRERFGTDVIVGYGMTETGYGAIERIGSRRRPSSCGQPREHPDPRFTNELRIVDAESGAPVAPNEVGEVTIRNPAMMSGYWRSDEQTREALRDGWLYTGDLGRMDEDGFLYYVDRKKDIIRRRGENISSQEVEGVVKCHPSVMDCAVIAVPTDLGEDEVKAYVVLKPDTKLAPADIIYGCAEHLAYFKVPRYLEMRKDLPSTPTLRVRKDLLRNETDDPIAGCFDREAAGIRIR